MMMMRSGGLYDDGGGGDGRDYGLRGAGCRSGGS